MSKLLIAVPKGRGFCGQVMLVSSKGDTLFGPVRVLATASRRVAKVHGNPEVSPLLPFGHPPAGTYTVAASLPPGYAHKKRTRRYGRVGALLLAPQSGDAAQALGNGRKLIALHGGPLDTQRRLRPTRGGIRLTNKGVRELLSSMNDASLAGDPMMTIELVEIDMDLARDVDAKGSHALLPPPSKRGAASTTTNTLPMVLLPLALGAGGKRSVQRRDVLITAALAFGALAAEACNRASNCTPLACIPDDAGGRYLAFDGGKREHQEDAGGCPPRGYVCEYYGGGIG
jgi:hypothetical protein